MQIQNIISNLKKKLVQTVNFQLHHSVLPSLHLFQIHIRRE